MKEKLARLKLLQAVDQVLDGLKEQRDALPRELAELEAELAALQDRHDRVQERYQELTTLKGSRGIDRTKELDQAKRYEAQLQEVKNNREYQALLREVGFAKKAAAELEEEISRIGEEIAQYEGELETATTELESKKQQVEQKRQEAETSREEVERSLAEEAKRYDELRKDIPRDLLSRYNLVRKRTNLVVVGVGAGACHGCFMALPPQLYNQVRRVDTLYTCPNCHRVLFHEPEPAAEQEAVEA